MRPTPLLILAYNRPDNVRSLLERLRQLRPPRLMISVDGPNPNRAGDAARVEEVRRLFTEIDWTTDIETRFRPANVGLRRAVVDSVNWAIERHGKVIVLEEDALPGAAFLPYMEHMLEAFKDDERIAHISGYHLVPPDHMTTPGRGSRLSLYPESFAWATWERAWSRLDLDLEWSKRVRVRDLAALTGGLLPALKWKQNFSDARHERISTWAYRWIDTVWSQGGLVLSPNANLVTYTGYTDGTHTVTAAPWSELPLYEGPIGVLTEGEPSVDPRAEEWTSRVVFRGTLFGVTRGVAVTFALALRKWKRAVQARRRDRRAVVTTR